MPRERICLIGKQFGRLKVIADGPPSPDRIYWRRTSVCVCSCGKSIVALEKNLKNGNTKSCGCLKRDAASRARSFLKFHRMANTRVYISWKCMKSRCYNPKGIGWKHYGGRGIFVCERWLKFENFFEDMGVGAEGWSIDRIDPNGNYEPGNVVWSNKFQQARNKRNMKRFTVNGITGCLADLCDRFNTPRKLVRSRINCGWDIVRAFFCSKILS